MNDETEPGGSFGYQARATHRAFDRLLQKHLAPHDLPNGFWYLLRALWEQDGTTQRELADAAHLTESSNVLMLDKMERAGLVERRRDTIDRRCVRVHLTAKARRMKGRLLPVAREINDLAREGIPPEDLEAFLRVCARMSANLRRATG